jgi:hypothetical protein
VWAFLRIAPVASRYVARSRVMIAAVQRFGWIDQANHPIRAHIEYAP